MAVYLANYTKYAENLTHLANSVVHSFVTTINFDPPISKILKPEINNFRIFFSNAIRDNRIPL